ncbi:MAG: inorganic phosphate transporter [Gammaproteobacteria bacterium]|nr:inorganic phosphate transporter [Gammaproteobacteria bacterium]MBU1730808.1 inorganic phosphate transporter [Gammaproteobacteria bacterium]MBU1891354.1 inorganic phosphate transporter [Gammaproteobacteria bacterium]
MKITDINKIERATRKGQRERFRFGIALLFITGIMFYTWAQGGGSFLLIMAAMIGGYMAMNIGANDVANNVGPAVGSRALTMTGALIIAAVCEAAGALIAGGDVVQTIRGGIISQDAVASADAFVWLMMAALLAGAIWLNIATAVGAPVSTTHSIVGGVLGAGIAAGGWGIANWGKMGAITASWVISPLLGGIIAAAFLYLIKRQVTYQREMMAAARRTVPLLVAFMAWAFTTYLMLKGVRALIKVNFISAALAGLAVAFVVYLLVRPSVDRQSRIQTAAGVTDKARVNSMFTIPLIFAAALLSFAHGANDVANAIGPLAAIADVLDGNASIGDSSAIPFWVMMVGAIGISIGLALFGPKLIRTVGTEITELDQTRAFCVALAATITVIIASQFGLPVSSTHIAVGGIFGVGFLREYLKSNYARMVDDILSHHPEVDQAAIEAYLQRFDKAPILEKGRMLEALNKEAKAHTNPELFSSKERKGLRKVYRGELVKRSHLLRIAAAWVITVPASALLGALLYYAIRGAML